MRPYQTILVLEDLQNSFVGPLCRNGVELSSRDRKTVTEVYLQWLLLMVDLGYLSPETLSRDARRILSDMMGADVLDLNNCFAELLQLVRLKQNRGFKVLCNRVSSHLYNLVKIDVTNMIEGDVYSAYRLVQLFSYTSRLTLYDIDLTQQCLDDYCAVEESILPLSESVVLPRMRSYIRAWMKPFDPVNITFRHGPGAVAGTRDKSLCSKYKNLATDPLLEYAFGSPWWCQHSVLSKLDRTSETIFVPKSYKTFRTISKEPSTLQYCQQGVWGEIDRVVSRSKFLRNRIGFHEQRRNTELARIGSIRRNYATIDLSAASDSVSYALVKYLFKGTKLLRYIVATRSRETVLPDGRRLKLKKFAPMGSALCFPIQTIIFASICQCVTLDHGVPGDYSVYGDDIIVPTQCVDQVTCILGDLGFRVNTSKTFSDSKCWFRESCGAEFCDGFDVTPMRISRKYNDPRSDVHTARLVQLSNAAYAKGYRNLRTFFVRKLRTLGIKALFSPSGLHSDNYTNYHLKKRWCRSLQRTECRVSDFTIRYKERLQDESIRLRHWFESTQHRVLPDDGFRSNVGRMTMVVRDRWIMKPEESHDFETLIAHMLSAGENPLLQS